MVRLIVTGDDPEGASCFISDRQVPEGIIWYGRHGSYRELVEVTVPGAADFDLNGPDSGYTFQVFELPPDSVMNPVYAAGAIPLHDERGFHKTSTVDLVCVLDGEVVSEVHRGQVTLRAGDCLVQRGTLHAWRNGQETPARMLAVSLNDRAAAAGLSRCAGTRVDRWYPGGSLGSRRPGRRRRPPAARSYLRHPRARPRCGEDGCQPG